MNQLVFDDQSAHDVYQVHAVYDVFRKADGELCSKVLIYDSVDGFLFV